MGGRKKVLWLIKGLGLGGAEKLLTLALPYLDRERFQYEVAYFLPWKNALVPELTAGGIPVFCLNHKRAFDLRVILRLAHLLRERRPDIVHMHLPYAAIVGRIACKLAGVPVTVYTEHNVFERYHWATRLAHKRTYSLNDAVICVAEAVRKSVLAHYKLRADARLQTIYNGVDWAGIENNYHNSAALRAELGVPTGYELLVQVASFTAKKDHETLLHAAKLILAQRPHVLFLLVGQGPLETQLRSKVQALGIDTNVIFVGARKDALQIMAAADIVTLTSIYEAMGLVLLEAMALGRPVIATRVGGIPEVVVNGVTGVLVDPKKPEQLAEKILMLLDNRELRDTMSCNGPRWVRQNFDIRHMVAKVEGLYDELLSMKGA